MAATDNDRLVLPMHLPASYSGRVQPHYLERHDPDGTCTVRLISGQTVTLDSTTTLDFEQQFSTQQNSNTMWLYSLFHLRVVGEALRRGNEHLRSTWEKGWQDAVAHLNSPLGARRAASIPSGDHAAATRLRACLEASELEPPQDVLMGIQELAATTLSWLCEPCNYRANNHGLMASIALLSWHVAVERPAGEHAVRDIATQRILDLARTAFDEDGMCNENTVGYHNFNIRCYDDVLAMDAAEHLDPAFAAELKPLLETAESALALCILPDQTVPTLGDSARVSLSRPASRNGLGDFSRSGLAVVKDDRRYVSLVCGSRSEIHKHQDDSSLTLWHKNRPVLVDAGSYLYDRTDPYRRSMESSLGHSGFFVSEIDGVLRHDIVKAHPDYWACITQGPHDAGEGNVTMRCKYGREGHYTVQRRVLAAPDGWLAVRDTFLATDASRDRTTCQRWLLGPDLLPTRLGHGHWAAQSSGVVVSVLAHGFFTEDLFAAENTGDFRGWYSEQSGQKVGVHGLEFHSGGVSHTIGTVIYAGERAITSPSQVPAAVWRFTSGQTE